MSTNLLTLPDQAIKVQHHMGLKQVAGRYLLSMQTGETAILRSVSQDYGTHRLDIVCCLHKVKTQHLAETEYMMYTANNFHSQK